LENQNKDKDVTNAEDDILKAEEILNKYPPPEPSEALLSNIKANIGKKLQSRKSIRQRIFIGTAAAAAAIIILVFISSRFIETKPKKVTDVSIATLIPEALWESEDIAADDPKLSSLIEQIETVESELLAINVADNGHAETTDFWEMENGFTENETDYLKG
jgi:hypothetical protein